MSPEELAIQIAIELLADCNHSVGEVDYSTANFNEEIAILEKLPAHITAQTSEIERLRTDNAAISKAVIDISQERDLVQAEFRAYHKAWEEGAARIKELEAVLKEADQYRRESLDRVMEIANRRDDLKTLNDALMENGNGLRSRAQKAEARIKELEASLVEAERLIRKNADMINGYLARIAKLETQVAALREIAVENMVYLNRYRVDYEVDDSMMPAMYEHARQELAAEHPEAFGTEGHALLTSLEALRARDREIIKRGTRP